MLQKTQSFVPGKFAGASRAWVPGMVTGMAAGVGVTVLLAGSVATLMATLLIGGVVGSMKSVPRKTVQVAPIKDRNIRNYVFQALIETSRKLDEIIKIEEEFNAASTGGGEKDRRAMKAQPQLKVAAPPPPKMSGM